jgi:hypothetical protein
VPTTLPGVWNTAPGNVGFWTDNPGDTMGQNINNQVYERYYGEDISIVFSGPSDPSSWNLIVTVTDTSDNPITGLAAFPPVTQSGQNTITVVFTRLQTGTILPAESRFDVWRTDGGANTRLCGATLFLRLGQRSPIGGGNSPHAIQFNSNQNSTYLVGPSPIRP